MTFQILATAAVPLDFADRLTQQIASLKLNDRYESEVNTYVSSHAVALHLQRRFGGQHSVRSFLNLQARFETLKFYRNHWRPTLLAALARHDGFTDGGFAEVLPLPADLIDDVANL